MSSLKVPREVHLVRGTLNRAINPTIEMPESIKKRIPFAEWANDATLFTRERFIEETAEHMFQVYGLGSDQDRHTLMMLADWLQVYITARTEMLDQPLVVLTNNGKTSLPNPILYVMSNAMKECLRLMAELGLTPKTRLSHKAAEQSPYANLLKGYRRA